MENEFVRWTEDGTEHSAVWRSTSGARPPKKIRVADDTMTADEAYRLACEGTALLWRGDFHNARQLSVAVAKRTDRKPRKASDDPATAFHLHRQTQSRRAGILGMLLVPFDADQSVPLRRAPDVRQAVLEAYGPSDQPTVTTLRDLLGAIGAHEWQKKGVDIPALGARIHPGYGVFSPIRGEYVDLVAETPLPSLEKAFDIGTGTGVLAAVLAHRGVKKVFATEVDSNALASARANLERLGYSDRVQLVEADLFPEGRAPLVVCNPPWIPAKPTSPIEYAIYDPDSAMLRGFLAGLIEHLEPGGEGWLVLSDIAEHLGLRSRDQLLALFDEAGLTVAGRRDVTPRHGKVADRTDPLHAARAREVTSLWRLVPSTR
ncbi:class I SAM-dependent methyltransferase [Rhodococcus oxybenzonivorans]|uniref:methyltransferase n=1 Tax=Rhodococcus TaxID=1827 RepID=UPI00132035E8|nr:MULTISPECIES: class I SAM-dependent methyltransferase [Rhodococcus]MDV7353415.1 class I SAM-dependent methyltransferase [Rhodococcus oxybenzonivorans]QHE68654.1 Protein-N(5)-glutamine methyltransferase PrmC, methylates polypeptide chain release factors RF1 and RF2 [Rhodococcus sp. WAY2]